MLASTFAELKAKRSVASRPVSASRQCGIEVLNKPSVSEDVGTSAVKGDAPVPARSPVGKLGDGRAKATSHSSVEDIAFYPTLDPSLLELRTSRTSGRTLFARQRIDAGRTLLRIEPHLAILDKQNLDKLCARCMLDIADQNREGGAVLRRCSGCRAVYYCSAACQKAHWKPDLHKLECARLAEWATMSKRAGRPVWEHVPDTPIRAIGNLIMLRKVKDENWWGQVLAMADSPTPATPAEQEHLGSLALAVTQYLGGPEVVTSLLSSPSPPSSPDSNDSEARRTTRLLLSLVDKFGINSFSLTAPDISNIGVAVSPTVALINHACDPNVVVVWPQGPSGAMCVVAFRRIEAGEEIMSSYLDLTLPLRQRQEELLQQYKFQCDCSVCKSERSGVSQRQAFRCPKSSCSGLVPFPALSLDQAKAKTATVACERCKAEKVVNLDRAGDDLGWKWAMAEAEAQLAIKSEAEFEALPRPRQAAFEMVIHQLASIHCAHPSSHPLLALRRLAQDRSISLNVSLYSTSRYAHAKAFALSVLSGLSSLFRPGHPVRAIQHVVLARLAGLDEHGATVNNFQAVKETYERLRAAREEAELAFGKDGKGLLVEQLGADMERCERELQLRSRAVQSGSIRS